MSSISILRFIKKSPSNKKQLKHTFTIKKIKVLSCDTFSFTSKQKLEFPKKTAFSINNHHRSPPSIGPSNV